MKKSGNQNAFTLVELLVVVAIISVLAGLLLPVLENAIESARRIGCASNQKQILLAATSYADDFGDILPEFIGDEGNHFLDHPRLYASGDIRSGYFATAYLGFRTTSTPGTVFNCPSVETPDSSTYYSADMAQHRDVQYAMFGFSGCLYMNDAAGYTRYTANTQLQKLAAPVKKTGYTGLKKIMLVDHVGSIIRTIPATTIQFRNWSHDGQGLNSGFADGSVSWIPEAFIEESWNHAYRFPIGYAFPTHDRWRGFLWNEVTGSFNHVTCPEEFFSMGEYQRYLANGN